MICTKCNAQLPDGYRFCYKCGTMFAYPGETPEESVRLAKEQYQKYVQYIQAQRAKQEALEAQAPQKAAEYSSAPEQAQPETAQQVDPFSSLDQQRVSSIAQSSQVEPHYAQPQIQVQPAPQPQIQTQTTLQPQFEPQPQPQQQIIAQPQVAQSAQRPQPAYQQPTYVANTYVAPYVEPKKATSGAAIAALIVGIVALLTSFLPIINNFSFILALVGFILAIVGIVGTKKGKGKKGRGLAVAALIINIVSIVLVLVTQSLFVAALNSVVEGPQPVASTTQQGSAQGAQADYSSMNVGESVTLENGMTITVTSVRTGLADYSGSPITEVTVSYSNGGKNNESFNPYDWKVEDANGVLDYQTFMLGAENELTSGQLSPGGSVSGNIYFKGDAKKIYYYNTIMQSSSNICWIVP